MFELVNCRRVLIFPKGNNVDHLSMYLDVADSATLPYGWSRYAQFSLSVVNQIHSKYTVRKGIIFANMITDFNYGWLTLAIRILLLVSSVTVSWFISCYLHALRTQRYITNLVLSVD